MIVMGPQRVVWSPSDVRASLECEYAFLRRVDGLLGRVDLPEPTPDPMRDLLGRLGDRHEAELLTACRDRGGLVELTRPPGPASVESLQNAAERTLAAMAEGPTAISQACLFDGRMLGYADILERADDGWRVCDAKLARSETALALVQLGAYADQLLGAGVQVSSTASLLLGSGERRDLPTSDLVSVFREVRGRFEQGLQSHLQDGREARWADDARARCGRCEECLTAAEVTQDVLLVAGVDTRRRTQLRAAGISTVTDLARADEAPEGMVVATFERVREQARLQVQASGGRLAHRLTQTAGQTLALLPAPSEGDLFFDFEGDPHYDEGDRARSGLQYLWGVMDAAGAYVPTWAHSFAAERAAFARFVDDLTARRERWPDLHVYHYAAYETSALKAMAMRYQVREEELDDLLRAEVFVDLYAVVRGSVQVSASSYSIKKLEPLYMGSELRSEDGVSSGDASILAYHEFRLLEEVDPGLATRRLDELADYNRYDCLSTLRLRDWLVERAEEAGVRDRIVARALVLQSRESAADESELEAALLARAGDGPPAQRSEQEQAWAMLATAIGYHRREAKQFWWGHFDRLQHPLESWARTRDVFAVESAEVVADWSPPVGKGRNHRRILRLVGDWAPGSTAKDAQVVYPAPGPGRSAGPEGAPYAAGPVERVEKDRDDPRVVLLTESCHPDLVFADLPVALAPKEPPRAEPIPEAIAAVASQALQHRELSHGAATDLLARRLPRLRDGGLLPHGSGAGPMEDVVAALLEMDDSYVAIQGPPGTGKTYTGSRVIRRLVEDHGWRVGVVAQSHAVVENMLGAVVGAGLDPSLVGKSSTRTADPSWTPLGKDPGHRTAYLEEHRGSGCVLGGTAWTFSHRDLAESGGLDLLVIDEAGQFALAPTIGASRSARRLLLLGDPQQLPQVSQGTHAEPVDESALGWLMGQEPTLPPERGYFLEHSYRMHPAVTAPVSALAYAGQLGSADPPGRRVLDGVEPGLKVVQLEHHGHRTESEEEAQEVVRQVRAHLGATWTDPDDSAGPRPLGQTDVLVVAPYNAQVAMIRAHLAAAGLPGVRVGTVDAFQGQEAVVAILSMTASSAADVPRGMRFLLSRNRLNVALSRAQWKAILIRSAALTAHLPSSPEGVLQLGAFISLCEAGDPRDDHDDRGDPRDADAVRGDHGGHGAHDGRGDHGAHDGHGDRGGQDGRGGEGPVADRERAPVGGSRPVGRRT
ncbi:TM0106 family RecB-like putative nuclease [Serinicoccus profundi]|uniref:TM0106 family RecB-like putative nuclease n=1 Tax=Serinicoccus profundi TaxID=1078471 RepID=UPI000255E25D|nr:bifunctional RecB family nuclease/DEAD/DEAH box helicase [Serinicoccus profundi]